MQASLRFFAVSILLGTVVFSQQGPKNSSKNVFSFGTKEREAEPTAFADPVAIWALSLPSHNTPKITEPPKPRPAGGAVAAGIAKPTSVDMPAGPSSVDPASLWGMADIQLPTGDWFGGTSFSPEVPDLNAAAWEVFGNTSGDVSGIPFMPAAKPGDHIFTDGYADGMRPEINRNGFIATFGGNAGIGGQAEVEDPVDYQLAQWNEADEPEPIDWDEVAASFEAEFDGLEPPAPEYEYTGPGSPSADYIYIPPTTLDPNDGGDQNGAIELDREIPERFVSSATERIIVQVSTLNDPIKITGGFMEPSGHGYKGSSARYISGDDPGNVETTNTDYYNIGIDYVLETSPPVVESWYTGEIISSGLEGGYGYRVHIKTDQVFEYEGKEYPILTAYAHLDSIDPDILNGSRTTIGPGESMGVMGGTGSGGVDQYQDHVDLQIWIEVNGQTINISPNALHGG